MASKEFFGNTELASLSGENAIEGYAALFNSPTESEFGVVTVIAPGAFDEALKANDVIAFFNHDDSKVLGRLSAKTLSLSIDTKGLRYRITPPHTGYAADLAENIKLGNIRGSSFGMWTGPDSKTKETTKDGLRTIERADLFDVSVVTMPRFPETDGLVHLSSKHDDTLALRLRLRARGKR